MNSEELAEYNAEVERMAAEMQNTEPSEQDRLRADVDYLLMMMEG